jgi:deoxyribonuclease IV
MFIGAHVSIAGGFDKCLDRIVDLGGNTLMTFASSPRSLQTKGLSDAEIQEYLSKKARFHIGPHFFHGVYLINLASESKTYLKASTECLIHYQRFAAQIGAVGTIFHIGSHKGRGLSDTLTQIVQSINYILDNSPKGIKLIIENCAGQGGTIGEKFEELELIINRIGDKSKLGICLDTQHAFAAGYNLSSVIDQFDHVVGLKHLDVIHFNNSSTDFNSHVDRHANLDEGKIDMETMKKILNHPRLKNIPFILETPGDNHTGPRKQDIELLKTLMLQSDS